MFTLEKKSISDQILLHLRKEIMLKRLDVGFHLKETEISERLKVSRGPVREALTQLEKENLVEKRLNGRTVVGSFEQRDIENLYNARILLEKAALAETDMETFNKNLDRFNDYIKSMEDADGKNEADLAFHQLIIKMPDNKTLEQLWTSLNGIVVTLLEITNEYLSIRQQAAIHEHEAIIENMKQGKVKEAQQALEDHLTGAAKHYMNAVNDITVGR